MYSVNKSKTKYKQVHFGVTPLENSLNTLHTQFWKKEFIFQIIAGRTLFLWVRAENIPRIFLLSTCLAYPLEQCIIEMYFNHIQCICTYTNISNISIYLSFIMKKMLSKPQAPFLCVICSCNFYSISLMVSFTSYFYIQNVWKVSRVFFFPWFYQKLIAYISI